jgi:hypothetical protein
VGTGYSAHVQTGPGTHPTSYTMGTRSLRRVKRTGRGIDYPRTSSAEVKERVEIYLYFPLDLRGLFIHSFSILSDKSKASSKTVPPHSAV